MSHSDALSHAESNHLITDTSTHRYRRASLLLAHGAGAPMDSIFMQQLAEALNQCGVDVVRFEFPYMHARRLSGKRAPPNSMPLLLESFREQWAAFEADQPGPLLIGGKSMGGRVASMLADELGAAGLVCFGYPFHPPGKPEKTRVDHLERLVTPALIIQGTRDPFGKPSEVADYALAPSIALHWLATADHDFKPLKKTEHDQSMMIDQAAHALAEFLENRLC